MEEKSAVPIPDRNGSGKSLGRHLVRVPSVDSIDQFHLYPKSYHGNGPPYLLSSMIEVRRYFESEELRRKEETV